MLKPTTKLHLNACNSQCCNLFLQLEVVDEEWIRVYAHHVQWIYKYPQNLVIHFFLPFFHFDLVNLVNKSFLLNLLSFILSLLMFILSLLFLLNLLLKSFHDIKRQSYGS